MDKRDLLQYIPYLLGNSAQDMEVVPHDLDIDRRASGGSLLLLGDVDFGARDVFDTLSDLFSGLTGRLYTVLKFVELDADVVG